jgi:DNA-binding XRE family transcriptional regulator
MKKTKERAKTSDATEILHRRYVKDDPGKLAQLEAIRADNAVARKIFNLRVKADLSQRELAKLIGTSASAICRLEDADYEGHSLAMLNRIADALDQRVEIRFVPMKAVRARPGRAIRPKGRGAARLTRSK